MMMLYLLLIVMLIGALGLLAIPFIVNKQDRDKCFWLTIIVMFIFSLGLYQFTSDSAGLKQWLKQGRAHYQLLVEYDRLGGVDGMIERVKKKLAANPNDKQGWFILSKLYRMKNDEAAAAAALSKAQPDTKR